MSSQEIPGIDWSAGRILPAFQPPQQLTIFDLRGASQDVQLSATTMAGLINRPQPMAYFIIEDNDEFWRKELLGAIPQETSPSKGDEVLAGMLLAFRSCTKGMIIYDPNMPDSINIATTLAGQRDGIVVSPTQVQELQDLYHLPILEDLRTYQWSNRLQAYDWARENLLDGASAHIIAGLDPRNTAGVRSFLVANCGFVYWLDARKQLPDSTDSSKSERSLIEEIFAALPPGAVHLGWFIDEGSGVALASQAALPVLASDLSFNLEVWASVQPEKPQVQTAPVVQAEPLAATDQVYVSFSFSDGDNLQYSQRRMLHLWQDPARGSVPIGWTISPALMQGAPSIADYYVRTATPNDELIAGPSGAAYMYPSHWPEDHFPSFLQRTGLLMQSLQMKTILVLDADFTLAMDKVMLRNLRQPGMIVNDKALQDRFIQALAPFGVRNILNGAGLPILDWYVSNEGVVFYQNIGLADNVARTLSYVRNAATATQSRPLFLNVYIVAWTMTPSDLKGVMKELGSGFTAVKPCTLLAMLVRNQA